MTRPNGRQTSFNGVRIFSSPSRDDIIKELSDWARKVRKESPEIKRIGLFGSYSKNTHAVGSDIDLLIIVAASKESRWFMRSSAFNTSDLSLPVDIFVYTQQEAERMTETNLWYQSVLKDIVWF